MTDFRMLSDADHSWLEVTPGDCKDIGLSREDFTPYSYEGVSRWFLDEDQDVPTFNAAFKARHGRGIAVEFVNVAGQRSPIRLMPSLRAQRGRSQTHKGELIWG